MTMQQIEIENLTLGSEDFECSLLFTSMFSDLESLLFFSWYHKLIAFPFLVWDIKQNFQCNEYYERKFSFSFLVCLLFKLWKISDNPSSFRVGYRWITRFLALGCYAILLLPGFLQGFKCWTLCTVNNSLILLVFID